MAVFQRFLGKEPRFRNRYLHGEPSHASTAVGGVISKSRFLSPDQPTAMASFTSGKSAAIRSLFSSHFSFYPPRSTSLQTPIQKCAGSITGNPAGIAPASAIRQQMSELKTAPRPPAPVPPPPPAPPRLSNRRSLLPVPSAGRQRSPRSPTRPLRDVSTVAGFVDRFHRGQVLHLNIFQIFVAMQHLTPRHEEELETMLMLQ